MLILFHAAGSHTLSGKQIFMLPKWLPLISQATKTILFNNRSAFMQSGTHLDLCKHSASRLVHFK